MSESNLTEIRETFGFSQAEMALVLDIGVSLLKMVEAGKRNLPEKSQTLFQWLAGEAIKEKASQKSDLQFTTEEKRFLVLEWESKKRKQEKAIHKLERKYRRHLAALALSNNFVQQFPEKQNGVEIKILESIKLTAEAALMNVDEQEILKMKLDLMGMETILQHLKGA